jgi:hypothetical protein
MNIPKIAALVPANEHFTAQLEGEGLWITEAHAGSIEAGLTEAAANLATANQSLVERDTQLEASNGKLATATASVTNLTARIVELEAENTTLAAKAAGTFERTAKEKDLDPPKQNKYETSIDRQAAAMRES